MCQIWNAWIISSKHDSEHESDSLSSRCLSFPLLCFRMRVALLFTVLSQDSFSSWALDNGNFCCWFQFEIFNACFELLMFLMLNILFNPFACDKLHSAIHVIKYSPHSTRKGWFFPDGRRNCTKKGEEFWPPHRGNT